MNEQEAGPRVPATPGEYEAPAILWEEELPQGPNIYSACGKLEGQGGPCGASSSS